MKHISFSHNQTVFTASHGNVSSILSSGLQMALIKNTRDDVHKMPLHQLQTTGHSKYLYLTQGGLLGMNGNYSAGVLEGLIHFLPHTLDWLQQTHAWETT